MQLMNCKVTNIEELQALVQRVKAAQEQFSTFSQDKIDLIFQKAALAANAERISLAKMAVLETGMGIIEDKVIKNHFASEFIYNKYKIACDSLQCYRHSLQTSDFPSV